MKIEVIKNNKKLNIDSSCLPAWEKAGWKTVEEKISENKKASK